MDQERCHSASGDMHTHNGILLSHKKEWNCAIHSTMDLEGIILSEINKRKTNAVWYHLYVESKKYNKLVNITKKKQAHREQTSGY